MNLCSWSSRWRSQEEVCLTVGSVLTHEVEPKGAMLYTFDKGNLLWEGWDLGSDLDRDGWREKILQETVDVQVRDRSTTQTRVIHMGLCEEGNPSSRMIYILGGGDHYFYRWVTSSLEDQKKGEEKSNERLKTLSMCHLDRTRRQKYEGR